MLPVRVADVSPLRLFSTSCPGTAMVEVGLPQIMATRSNVLTLSAPERAKLVNGLLAMKQSGAYNKYIRDHALATRWTSPTGTQLNMAHMGPAFPPWHRKFLLDFERDLQAAIGSTAFGLPYYDWTDGLGASSLVWGADLMGGQGNPVSTGSFVPAAWQTIDANNQPTSGLIRQFGAAPDVGNLPARADVHRAFYRAVYDASPWNDSSSSFRNTLEGFFPFGLHNLVHVWIGGQRGQMSSVPVASNDPVFFLHHCNVDRIWAQWQMTYPTAGYLPTSGAGYGHNLNDPMYPWNTGPNVVHPADMLSISNLGYSYDAYYNIGTLQLIITTGSSTFSGTDDEVRFVISSLTWPGPFWSVTLDAAHCNHSNPFERGQTDTFTYPNVNNMHGSPPLTPALLGEFSLGKAPDNSWFGAGDWTVAGIQIIADGLVLYNNQSLNQELNNNHQHLDDGNGNKLISNP